MLWSILGGAVKGGMNADTGAGMKSIGNGFMMYDPGDMGKKIEGTVGGAFEGLMGGMQQKKQKQDFMDVKAFEIGEKGKADAAKAEAEAARERAKEQAAADKKAQRDAAAFDSSADWMKEKGLIPADANTNDWSVNQKASMMNSAADKLNLMQKYKSTQPEKDYYNDPRIGTERGGKVWNGKSWVSPDRGSEVAMAAMANAGFSPSEIQGLMAGQQGTPRRQPSVSPENNAPSARVSTVDGVQAEDVVKKIMSANPGLTPEQAVAKAMELGYIK